MTFVTVLSFVERNLEADDVYTFSFRTHKKPNHKAGQHGIFLLPGLHRPHPFSLTSAPHEEFITFTTHADTGSPFKRKLMKMQPGAAMYMIGPIMNFTFVESAPKHVFLAQGIGITPFRSMLVHAHHVRLPIETTLIHVDNKPHTFKEVTAQLATRAFYPSSSEEFRELTRRQDVSQVFYLSGSPRFVRATIKLLRDMGVNSKSIKTDSFLGY